TSRLAGATGPPTSPTATTTTRALTHSSAALRASGARCSWAPTDPHPRGGLHEPPRPPARYRRPAFPLGRHAPVLAAGPPHHRHPHPPLFPAGARDAPRPGGRGGPRVLGRRRAVPGLRRPRLAPRRRPPPEGQRRRATRRAGGAGQRDRAPRLPGRHLP